MSLRIFICKYRNQYVINLRQQVDSLPLKRWNNKVEMDEGLNKIRCIKIFQGFQNKITTRERNKINTLYIYNYIQGNNSFIMYEELTNFYIPFREEGGLKKRCLYWC